MEGTMTDADRVDQMCTCGAHHPCPKHTPADDAAVVRKGIGTVDAEADMAGHWRWFPDCFSARGLDPGDYDIRVEFRRAPKPAPIPWPWDDVSRVKIGPANERNSNVREIFIHLEASQRWLPSERFTGPNSLGAWPADESRIATRGPDGHVVLTKE